MANQGVNYGLLRGKIIDYLPFKQSGDHYQIEIQATGKFYRAAVDVYSQYASPAKVFYRNGKNNQPLETDRMVMFYSDANYKHPVTASMLNSAEGLTPKSNLPKQLQLDYIRYNPPLFDLTEMKIVPPEDDQGNPQNLNDDLNPWVTKAKNNANAEAFIFGSSWNDSLPGAEPDRTQYFNPNPTLGIHDIHMNQGDSGSEAHSNGIWQDGALFIYFQDADQWVAFFFRFQNQSIHTDEHGNPV